MGIGWILEPGHQEPATSVSLHIIYLDIFLSQYGHMTTLEKISGLLPILKIGKVSGASKIKRSKSWPFIGLGKKGHAEGEHSRQKHVGFILSIAQFSFKSDIDKVKCTRKSIFTSYFLSCVQSHTFRRLSLGEWPQRESASLLLNSKREKQSHKTYESKGNFPECLWSKWKGMGRFCSHVATSLLFLWRHVNTQSCPACHSLVALLVTAAPSEQLRNYLKEWCNF